MNLVQLEYFEAVFQKRSYAAAAKAIPMSHQGLLKSINALQKELGVPLFSVEEGSTVVVPTAYAMAFHEFVEAVRAGRDQLEGEFARIVRDSSTVRLGASTGVLGLLGLVFLRSFRSRNPALSVLEEEVADLRCDERLADGTFDLGLTVGPFDERFETVPLYRMDRYVWISRRDRLARRESVAIDDLAARRVGVVGPSHKNYEQLLKLAKIRGIEFARVDTSSELFWLSQYAHGSGCISFTAYHVVSLFERDSEIVARRFEGLPWEFGISWLKGKSLSDQERALVDYCRAFAHRKVERGVEGFLSEKG